MNCDFLPKFSPVEDLPLDRVDLPSTMVDEIVVALHDLFELLRFVAVLTHRHKGFEAWDLNLRNYGPVSFGTQVRQDSHSHSFLRTQLLHREKLLNHGTHLARLAIHDVANE